MKIAVVTSGSRGDVQPYVALGKGLQDAGHDVRLLGGEDFEALASATGLDFQSLGPNIQALTESDAWRQTLERGDFLAILRKMRAEVKKVATGMAQRLPGLLRGSDLIVAGMSGMGGVFAIAEQFAIPVVEAYVFPFTPTAAFSSPLFSRLPAAGLLNRLSFHLTHQLFWQNMKALDGAVRQTLEMERESFWGPFRRHKQQRTPVLYGYSPAVLPQPKEWGPRYRVTGYWFVDEPPGWQPPTDLLAFLEAGSPPVYIGFGSMRDRDPRETGRIALEALDRTGQRGVLSAGWGGLKPGALPATVHAIGSLPHSWLFPRMAAVVHHGGAGTTAAGLRAGVPSIVVPFMGDQHFWGKRVAELGVGPAPLPRKKLTAEALALAISKSLPDSAMRRRAASLGESIRDEDGVGEAVTAIDKFIK